MGSIVLGAARQVQARIQYDNPRRTRENSGRKKEEERMIVTTLIYSLKQISNIIAHSIYFL